MKAHKTEYQIREAHTIAVWLDLAYDWHSVYLLHPKSQNRIISSPETIVNIKDWEEPTLFADELINCDTYPTTPDEI